jgi:hypothetical protein
MSEDRLLKVKVYYDDGSVQEGGFVMNIPASDKYWTKGSPHPFQARQFTVVWIPFHWKAPHDEEAGYLDIVPSKDVELIRDKEETNG